MKKIEAIVRVNRVEAIKDALMAEGLVGMTLTEVRGFGRQKGHSEIYRGTEYQVNFVPKVKLELVVDDDKTQSATDTIVKTAKTGEVGDGKVFISEISDAIRVRTEESGAGAL